jgi:hypothetical protein
MFSVMQETEHGQKIWPGVSHVYTSENDEDEGPRLISSVTALFEKGGLMDFPMSRRKHNIYVMNEHGATVARYFIGNNPRAPNPADPVSEAADPA